jgi:hypothetical protein
MLVWSTTPTEVNGYKQILHSLGADDITVASFDTLATDMVEYAKRLAQSSLTKRSTPLKGQLLGAKLQMSRDDLRKCEMVVTRPRTDIGFDGLCKLHRDHGTHVFRVLIPLDDFGVWQILYPGMLMGKEDDLPKTACLSTMLFVTKASYAIIPMEIIFSENVMTSIYGNKHLEMYLMLSPQNKEYPALELGSPEYYCWGEMNVQPGPGRRDDRGMLVYPYESIPVRDRHLSTSFSLDKIMANLCLVQDFLGEQDKERKSRLEKWGLSEDVIPEKPPSRKRILSFISEEKKVEEAPPSEEEEIEEDPIP